EGFDTSANCAYGWIDPVADRQPWKLITDEVDVQNEDLEPQVAAFFERYPPQAVLNYARTGELTTPPDLEYLNHTAKTAMAERTGDPTLDKLIEDFMLLANKKVAEFIGKGKPGEEDQKPKNKKEESKNVCVYRVHDVPSTEKLDDLTGFVSRFGYELNTRSKLSTVQSINKLLVDVKGKKEGNMIELLTLRSMPKAIYTTKNIGHYGLGFDYYTHFTSPIRRYPDVLVHRLLEAKLRGQTYSNQEELEMLCKHSSDMERMAAEAERASIKYKQVEYMEDKVGQIFKGTISGVTEWGIYVEITENKCEGMIRSRDMQDDRYQFDEDNFRYVGRNTGRTYALGDSVMIEVKSADLAKKQLNFAFVTSMPEAPKKDYSRKRRR
ncbi:MAG: RNB domain-containing ribonuclease, partial [Bacteroidia bacterium]